MENYAATMEARQQGGGSFSTYNLDTGSLVDDDFLFLDHNLPSIDSIASDFSAFLDSAGPNGSLLPADEWSGTTNTLPDTPSSHQQLQHGLEGSSPLQSQVPATLPVIQTKQQQTPQPSLHPQQQQQQQQQQQHSQQFVFDNQAAAPPSQTPTDITNTQQSALGVDQIDSLSSRVGQQQAQGRPNLLQIENPNRHSSFPNRQMLLNGSTSQPSNLPLAGSVSTPREMVLQSSFQQSETSGMESNFGGPGQRNFESLQSRQLPGSMPGFQQGQNDGNPASLRMSFPRGLMANGQFGMSGHGQQIAIQGQQSMNNMPASDADALQTQLMNNQASFPGQFLSKVNNRQPISPGHGLNNIPSFQLQPSHQLQLQSQSKLHPQLMNQQVLSQGLLQPRQVPLGSQPSVFSSPQQSQYQLLQSQGYQMHPNAGNLPIGRQMFPQMQPRLQSQLLQGLRYAGALGTRQLGPQMVGPQIGAGVPDMGTRYPPPGTTAAKCAQAFMLCIQEQRKRPSDNNINFWRTFVQKYFAPGATKRWCLTSYSATPVGRHAQGLFPMDYWYCNLCGGQPGRGFESGTDVLPRLFKIKYDSGLLDELLFLDVATEKYSVPSGKVVLEYSRAVHESVFPELRVIRHGKLRITFNNQFKICSWEFCTKTHEEVVPRKNLLQQVHQLASLVIESDQENFDKSADNLKSHCNAFTKAAKQLAVQLDAPMVNDLGFSKRYVRCLQIAEVVNSMKDLISFERKTGLGPIESLKKFPTFKRLQMEGGLAGLPPTVSLTQVINELTQGSSLQSSTVTRLQSESMSEAHDQAQSASVFKGMEAASMSASQQRGSMETRLQHLLQSSSEAFNQMQASQAAQSTQVQSHSMNQGSHLTSPPSTLAQPVVVAQGPMQQQQIASNQQQQQQQNYQQAVLKSAATKSSLSQPHQASLPGTPQSEMSDMRSNT